MEFWSTCLTDLRACMSQILITTSMPLQIVRIAFTHTGKCATCVKHAFLKHILNIRLMHGKRVN